MRLLVVSALSLMLASPALAAPIIRVDSSVQGGGYTASHIYVPGGGSTSQSGTGSVLPSSTASGTPFVLAAQSGTTSGTTPATTASSFADLVSGAGGLTAISQGSFFGADQASGFYSYGDDFTVAVAGGGVGTIELEMRITGIVSDLTSVSDIFGYAVFGVGQTTQFSFGHNVFNPASSGTYVARHDVGQNFFTDFDVVSSDPTNLIFRARINVTDGSVIQFRSEMSLTCRGGAKCDYSDGFTPLILLGPGVTLTSAATGAPVAFARPVPEPSAALTLASSLGWVVLRPRNAA
ncbi:MAG: hypothetical protein FJ091_02035 [Deltaproteobacteria bacterium]|nr:hypothetical protein [Deltaproteobacteria bacterium]